MTQLFHATPEQDDFRAHARALYDAGMVLVAEWCRDWEGMSPSTFTKLWSEPGFTEWWRVKFPEHCPATEVDALTIDHEWRTALVRGFRKGDTRALQAWTTAKVAASKAADLNGNAETLAAYLEGDPEIAWHMGDAAEAR